MESFKPELAFPEVAIEIEVRGGLKQADVAKTYAMAMCTHSRPVDWERVNKCILSRWKPSGLQRIKNMARKML